MSGIVIFSDTHFVPQFVDEQIRVVTNILSYAKEHKADAIIFDGDLFESKDKIDVTLYNTVWTLFHDFSVSSYPQLILNTGNHDLISMKRESALKPFSAAVWKLVTIPETFVIDNFTITIVPYNMVTNEVWLSANRKDILFLHELIDVFTPETYKGQTVSAKTVSAKNLFEFNYVFNGHIHKSARYKNIYNIGSSFIADFGEEGEEKRFLYLTEEGVESVSINCPQYITVDGLSDNLVAKLEKDDRNIFRINVSPDMLSHPIFKKHNVRPNIVKSEKCETRLNFNSTLEEEIKAYVNQAKVNSLSKERLLEVGNQLLFKTRSL